MPSIEPFNIREKVKICGRKDDSKIRQTWAEKNLQKSPVKNLPKLKQVSGVMALTDSDGIGKLHTHPAQWVRVE